MSTQPSEREISKAVLDFAAEGTYPESENIVAANVPLSALSKELELITQARDQVEVCGKRSLGFPKTTAC